MTPVVLVDKVGLSTREDSSAKRFVPHRDIKRGKHGTQLNDWCI